MITTIACRFSYILHWNKLRAKRKLIEPSSPENGRTACQTFNIHQRGCITASERTGWCPEGLLHTCAPLANPSTCARSCTQQIPKVSASGGATTSRHHILKGDGLSRSQELFSVDLDQLPFTLWRLSSSSSTLHVSHAHTRRQFSYEAHPAPLFSDAD